MAWGQIEPDIKGTHLMSLSRFTVYTPVMRGILRIVSGALFFAHGLQKFAGFPPGEMAGAGLTFSSAGAFAGVIELIAGFLIMIGLWTRPAAFIASGTMAFAYFIGHAPQNFFPVNNGGDAAILYCFLFLYFVFAGGGAWGIDYARDKSRFRR